MEKPSCRALVLLASDSLRRVGQLAKLRDDCQSALCGFSDKLVLWLRLR